MRLSVGQRIRLSSGCSTNAPSAASETDETFCSLTIDEARLPRDALTIFSTFARMSPCDVGVVVGVAACCGRCATPVGCEDAPLRASGRLIVSRIEPKKPFGGLSIETGACGGARVASDCSLSAGDATDVVFPVEALAVG